MLPGTGLRYTTETRPYGAPRRSRGGLWLVIVAVAVLLAVAGSILLASASARAQKPLPWAAPFKGVQWAPIKESMHGLVSQGYAIIAVDGQNLGGGGASTAFYLLRGTDLVRCAESYTLQGPYIFPCERLVAPQPSK